MAEVAEKNELQTLVTGAEGRVTLKDKDGKEHSLSALDLADIVEYEGRIKSSVLDFGSAVLKLSDILFLLYLSLRKEGRSNEQVARRDFAYSEPQVYRMFNLQFLARANEVFLDLLKISGLEIRPSAPPKAE